MTEGARPRRRAKRGEVAAAVDQLPSDRELSALSNEEWIKYIRTHFRPSVVSDLTGIQQTAEDARQPNPSRPAKRKAKHARRAAPTPGYGRIHRYITHAVVLAVAVAMTAHSNPGPLIVVGGIGFVALAVLFLAKDTVSSAVAFTIRGRSQTGSYEVAVRVKASSWDSTKIARVLDLTSILLPPEYRAEFVEDQAANLLATESQREQVSYLIDLILELPRVAWQFYAERRRDSVK